MIDWVRLSFHVTWIFGASLLLANYSYRSWARQIGLQLTQRETRNRLISDMVAYAMAGVGLTVTADPLWRKLLWLVVIALMIGQKFLTEKSAPDSTDHTDQMSGQHETEIEDNVGAKQS